MEQINDTKIAKNSRVPALAAAFLEDALALAFGETW